MKKSVAVDGLSRFYWLFDIFFSSNKLQKLLGCQNIFLNFKEKGLIMPWFS